MENYTNQIFYYGIGDAEKNFKVLNYEFIESARYSLWLEGWVIEHMLDKNPGICEIYAIDNRRGLKRDFAESIKEGSVESCQIFKDILRREGKKVYPYNK